MTHTLSNTGSNSSLHRGFPARMVPFVGMALLVLVLAAAIGCGSEPQPQPQPQSQQSPVSTTPPDSGRQAASTASPTVAETGRDAGPAATEATTEPTAGAAATTPEQPATEASDSATAEVSPTTPATVETVSETVSEAATEPATSAPAATQAPPTEAAEPTAATVSEPADASEGGAGYVISEGSKATFTVNEKLAWLDLPNDAVMHTEGLTGNVSLDGQPSVIELDLHSMTSDSDRRDGYVRQRMFPEHRVATFTVPDLGELPDPLPEGEVITREVQGELTIKGVTKAITFEVDARRDPDKLFILGRTTFTWDDLEIPPPNIPGRIQVKDEVQVEVLLSAVPAGS